MFSDFHSDVLTACGGDLTATYRDNNIITAVFRGKRSFSEALKISEKARLLAYEDAGYNDLDEDKLIASAPLYVGLTWNGENRFGYGCDSGTGLKKEGKEFIGRLNAAGIAVDCAHISKGGFKDIIELAETAVDSHTCFSAVHEHKRNLDDWQLKELVSRGGLVGVTCCGYFMTDEKHCKISDFIKQIDYFVQKFGADNLAVGTDFYGCDFIVEDILGYEELYGKTAIGLKKLGYPESAIDKLLSNNLRIFTEKRRNGRLVVDKNSQ